jgi:glycosyltransferase involved in cell wall biosynthesis
MSDRAIEVSVIIPSYNEQQGIGACLRTLGEQTTHDHEIIVVDDGSTDRTREIVAGFPVRLLEQSHRGPAAARNWGASEARGSILVFVDADMSFDRGFLEALTAPIRSGKAIGTFTKDEIVGNPGKRWAVCWNLETVGSPDRRIGQEEPEDSVVFRAILRETFLGVGGFDTAVGYDDDHTLYPKLGVKALRASGALCYHDNPGTLREVFQSARWIGRSRRFSEHPERLLKFFPPFSLFNAVTRVVRFGRGDFLVFKLVHDSGIALGGLSRFLLRAHTK